MYFSTDIRQHRLLKKDMVTDLFEDVNIQILINSLEGIYSIQNTHSV